MKWIIIRENIKLTFSCFLNFLSSYLKAFLLNLKRNIFFRIYLLCELAVLCFKTYDKVCNVCLFKVHPVCTDVCICACVYTHTHRNARVCFVELTAVEGTSIRVKKGKQRQSKGTNHALRRLGSGENSPSPPLLRLSLLASGITNISMATFPPSRSLAFASIRDSRDLSPTFANRQRRCQMCFARFRSRAHQVPLEMI